MNIKKLLIQKSKHIYRHTKNRIIYIFASLLNTPYSKSSKPSLTYPLTKILRGSIIYACLRNVKSSLQRLVKILLKANPFPALSNPATHKGEAMKTQFKATQRLAALGAITLLSAFLIACGGGGGGGAVGGGGATAPVTPTVPPVTTTGPIVTPTVPVVTPTVSVTCPNTNPVVVVQGSNANDYSNCPVVIVTPVTTWGSVTAAVTPVAMNVKTFIANSANNGSGVGQIAATCTDVTSQCYLNALTAGVVKRISTTALMTGGSINPTAPVEFHYYKIQSGSLTLSCTKPVYVTDGVGVFSNSTTFGCSTGSIDWIRTNSQGIDRHDVASGLCFQLAWTLVPAEAWASQPGAVCAP